MLTSTSLELVNLVVFKDKAEEVSAFLLKAGIFHPVDIRNIESELAGLSLSQIEKDSLSLEALHGRCRTLARKLRVSLVFSREAARITAQEAGRLLDRLEEELKPLLEKKEELSSSVKNNSAILSRVKEYLPLPIRRDSTYSFLEIAMGRVEEKNLAVLERSLSVVPHILYPFNKQGGLVSALLIGLRRDRELIRQVLGDVGWNDQEFPRESEVLSREAQRTLELQIRQYSDKLREVEKEVASLRSRYGNELSGIHSFCVLSKSILEAKKFSAVTEKTIIFTGWVPKENKGELLKAVKQITDLSYVEWRDAGETGVPKEDIPVQFAQSKALKPFALLVDAYGVPRYGTLDPTIFVAISFLLMFGMMFGDLGHGLVLIAAAAGAFIKTKAPKIRQAAVLIAYCGASSALFGFLYGSVFGFEFHSLWHKPMEDVMGLLRFSVLLGIGIITTGIIINVINAIRDRDYLKALFDKSGLIAGLVYWALIALITRGFFLHAPVPRAIVFIVTAGITMLFLYPIMEYFLHGRKKHPFFESVIESVMGLLEFVMAYLANTVSFVRMGAFALAHAALFMAIFQISAGFKGWGSIAVIVGGNIAVIILEGVVVSIQSLRLNYYEFFSKFFVPGKTEFKPLSV